MRTCPGLPGRPCGAFMTAVDTDPHTLCPHCRGQRCDSSNVCIECREWSTYQWEGFPRRRKKKAKSDSLPRGSSLTETPLPRPINGQLADPTAPRGCIRRKARPPLHRRGLPSPYKGLKRRLFGSSSPQSSAEETTPRLPVMPATNLDLSGDHSRSPSDDGRPSGHSDKSPSPSTSKAPDACDAPPDTATAQSQGPSGLKGLERKTAPLALKRQVPPVRSPVADAAVPAAVLDLAPRHSPSHVWATVPATLQVPDIAHQRSPAHTRPPVPRRPPALTRPPTVPGTALLRSPAHTRPPVPQRPPVLTRPPAPQHPPVPASSCAVQEAPLLAQRRPQAPPDSLRPSRETRETRTRAVPAPALTSAPTRYDIPACRPGGFQASASFAHLSALIQPRVLRGRRSNAPRCEHDGPIRPAPTSAPTRHPGRSRPCSSAHAPSPSSSGHAPLLSCALRGRIRSLRARVSAASRAGSCAPHALAIAYGLSRPSARSSCWALTCPGARSIASAPALPRSSILACAPSRPLRDIPVSCEPFTCDPDRAPAHGPQLERRQADSSSSRSPPRERRPARSPEEGRFPNRSRDSFLSTSQANPRLSTPPRDPWIPFPPEGVSDNATVSQQPWFGTLVRALVQAIRLALSDSGHKPAAASSPLKRKRGISPLETPPRPILSSRRSLRKAPSPPSQDLLSLSCGGGIPFLMRVG
ncbi:proline-rich protein 36-like [Palaemon carinicauda]|uniref:proline-rich protein 36-like n=1 Tax=Palaemon carinicauda TaxID=392227 RepID=UPI0035B5DB63